MIHVGSNQAPLRLKMEMDKSNRLKENKVCQIFVRQRNDPFGFDVRLSLNYYGRRGKEKQATFFLKS